MRRGKITNVFELLAIVVIVLVAQVATGNARKQAEPLPPPVMEARFDGKIINDNNAPVVGATIVIRGPGTWSGTSDSAGHFVSNALPVGQYVIVVQATGYGKAQSRAKLANSQAVTKVVVRLASVVQPKKVEPVAAKPADKTAVTEREMPMPAPRSRMSGQAIAAPLAIPAAGDRDVAGNTEDYAHIVDNPFLRVANAPLSTFAADVDTASYANVRRFLRDGALPPKDAVRIEELINYFHYNDATPTGKDPFAVSTELAVSPWNPQYKLLRIGLRAPAIADSQVPARNLVFLLDVSGSMNDPRKLPLLKQAMNLLTEQLRPQDRVAIAMYAGASGVALPSTTGDHKDAIRNAVALLEAGGSTNGAAGIQLAYDLAQQHFIKGGINRVILATDGDFNVGVSSEGDLIRLIEEKREKGVFLTVLGLGTGNVKDSKMEKLADHGNGNYAYIDTIDEARKVLVKEAGATLVTVAKDVKLQVEFNPAAVAGYRLVGYENRMLRDQDFNDDKKDAGDIGAGHTVTALYEIVPAGVEVPGAKVDALKYQPVAGGKAAPAGNTNELLTVKLRYKQPTSSTSALLSRAVAPNAVAFANASENLRWAATVASFGMLLRGSPHVGAVGWNDVTRMAAAAKGKDAEGYRSEFMAMVGRAVTLTGGKAQIAK